MSPLISQLLELYFKLGSGIVIGWILGNNLAATTPIKIGKFLYWVGVPLSIFAFLRKTELISTIWLAPLIAWLAMLSSVACAWLWLQWRDRNDPFWTKSRQGSFLLSAMVGNTGYMGYPIVLSLFDVKYFAIALFYDLFGTILGAYGFGVILAAYFGSKKTNYQNILKELCKNPALWSLGLGLICRPVALPNLVENSLQIIAWSMLILSLVLIGMRLSQIKSWKDIKPATISLSIKMLIIPLILGIIISLLGVTGTSKAILVLQMAMPPAFATLVIAETYNLDKQLTVTALVVGPIILLVTLPLWLFLFN